MGNDNGTRSESTTNANDEGPTEDGTNIYHIDPKDEARVRRRIDFFIMPAMVLVFFFEFLDKQTINYAAVFGLSDSLDLSGSDFSWAVSLFYFGQLAAQYPSAYFISRFPVVKVVALTIALWGAMEMCLAATHNAAGLCAVRFFLGFAEGASSPGFVIITSNFYKRKEHPIRVAWWQSCSGFSQIIGAVVMYLIGQADSMALENWRVMFLVCGGATITAGIFFSFFMPCDTSTAWFLSAADRKVASDRLALDRATRDKSSFNIAQVKEALTDPQTWLLFCMGLFICIPSPILKFSSLVINGFGFNQFRTMLVGLPGGALQIATIWAGALGMRHTKNKRWLVGILLACVPLLGSVLLLSLPASAAWGIVVSTWLAACSSSLIAVALSFTASNVKCNTKKAVVSGVFFVAYCTGCIVGPQLWQKPDAPRYIKGCISSVVSWVLFMTTLLVYRFVLQRENRWRDEEQMAAEGGEAEDDDGKTANIGVATISDLTDRQDRLFRYTL